MGIDYHHAALIIREHSHKPLPKTVYLVGRQTVRLTYDDVMLLCRESGVDPVPIEIEIDTKTRNAQNANNHYMTDTSFFKLLGVENVHIDLNSPAAEIGALEILFERMSPGAVLVFDDYGWKQFYKQKDAEDAFMLERGYSILELPTGQGLVVKR